MTSWFGCLEEIVESIEIGYSNSADLITYTETRTSFFEREEDVFFVTVDELNQNLNSYFVLDIRDSSKFKMGHIPGAVNVQMKNLLEYLWKNEISGYQKIIIVSNTGQLASYTSALLVIAGFENVFPLHGGMAYWHNDFSDEIRDIIGNDVLYIRNLISRHPSGFFNSPEIYCKNNTKTVNDKIAERVQLLLEESEFNIFISSEMFNSLYSKKLRGYENGFVIYSEYIDHLPSLNFSGTRWIRGPVSSILFNSPVDFISHNSLLKIPVNKDIFLYSSDGQRSSYYTAYLKMVGYAAKTIKYGELKMMCLNIRPIVKRGGVVGYDTTFCIDIDREIRDFQYDIGN